MTNQEDILITPSSDSFWEIGKYSRTVKRIDNGYKLCDSLRSLIDQRSEIEKNYAKQLTQWAKKWNDYLDRGPEYGTTQGAWRGLLCEADSLANLHTLVAENLMTKVYQSIKQWQKDNYHKSMMHFKETKEAEDGFKKAQKPWEKIYTKLQTAKKEFHNACRSEKSTANQENNARGDSAVSPDQLKKIQEKLKKCQADVESTREKYNAYLNDLNSYNPKYMEDMTLVFNKCQDAEKQRQEFFKKTLYDLHECVDLSSEPKFSQVYTELHNTISRADCNQDLAWWSTNHGVEMPMKWPTFEDYSPDLASISKKEKKSSQMGSDGIMITSIRHKTDSYNPPQQQETPAYNSQRSSQMSNNSATNNEGYTGPYSGTSSEQPTATESYSSDLRNRKKSYDEKLNPFGSDDESEKEPSPSKETPNQIDPIPEPVTNDTVENPFGDDEDDDDDKVPRECNILMKALYDYDAVEEDEISFKAGDLITMILTKDEMNWCRGKTEAGDIGHFPAGYAEEYHP